MVGFSFGLKKAAASSKPAPAKRKPATFGGDDDDENTTAGDGQPKPIAAIEITELDGFDDNTSTPIETGDEDRKSKKKSKGLPQPPPPVSASASTSSASASSNKKAPPVAAQFGDLSSALESRKYAQAAADADPSIYDYDAVYDSFKVPQKKEKEADNKEKRPRYFDALQKAAETRERDRAIAEEKKLKREREAEGDAFADKEKFVTEAYKRQQEENRRLEEEEKKREEEEAKKNKNKGLTDFYKQMLEKEELEHVAKMKAVEERVKAGPEAAQQKKEGEEGEGEGQEEEQDAEKRAAEKAKEINAMGGNVIINDDGEVVDKRQLLKGGLNVAPKKKVEHQQEKARQAAKPAAASGPAKGVFHGGNKQAMRERQTRMLEAQLEERLKRAREEEEEERKKVELVAKSRKTEADISSAKERYLARKRAAEEAKKKGLEEGAAP
ncbi:coiled-coil domain-containing protein 55-domain containing protein [Neurospora tetraspora]|uniref:Coiled-coil domain-containing protein 55-domain containing protein n=1 Tax=Neurospora tetraspora TaxID=94610 RepID=A0AAE0JAZ0_9PEZI|nr:coiled-coil domain-containing protein 55-domain containing protein [Neurospora tetraspora]